MNLSRDGFTRHDGVRDSFIFGETMGETMGFRLLAVISGSPVYFFDGAFRN